MERLGKYEIIEKIGEGGFGTVYKGRDPYIKRTVAIKTCSSDDEDLRKRFLREAEVVGTLHHPNVTMVHDFGFEGEVPYLVQEFLTGEDLSAIISRRESLTEARKLDILLQAARGLLHAHEHGIVHRDVKPNNIRVLADGKVKVMDFGIAKLAQLETRLTKTGMSIGTAAYMAPEQLNGEEQDNRCDIFAFGAMAYELLTYERPFNGETMSRIVFQILYEQPKSLTESELVPWEAAELDRLVRRCMAKDPAQRFGSFAEVIAELERLTGAGPTRERPIVAPSATSADQPTTLMQKPAAAVTPTQVQPPAAAAAPTLAASPEPKSKHLLVQAIGAGVVVVAVLVGWLLRGGGGGESPAAPAASPAPAPPAPVVTAPTPEPAARPIVSPPVAATPPPAPAPSPQRSASRPALATPASSRPQPAPAPVRAEAPPPEPHLAPPPVAPAATPAAAPSPPPVAVAPAPAPRPAPGPSAEEQVRDVLRAYEAAYEALDARAVKAVWPGLTEQRQRDLQQAFNAYRSLQYDLRDCRVEVTGDTAQASCQMRQEFQAKVGEGARREAPISFRLRRQGETWRIESIGS